MSSLCVRGGLVVTRDGVQEADVLIVNGMVAEIAPHVTASDAKVIDAHGCWVLPGFVDLHTHLREPGREEAETIETGTRAAVLGGYTAVVAMPNTEPTIDSVDVVRWIKQRASEGASCDVAISAAITKNRAGESLVDMAALANEGVHIFTDDGSGVQDAALMREAFLLAQQLGVILAEHCEDSVIANGGVMNLGEISEELGVPGMAAEAEELMLMRDIALSQQTGAPIHLLHLSTAKSVAMVREAKRRGIAVTAEATPHHFSLTHELLRQQDPTFKVNPPLRREQDRIAVLNGLLDGTIDVIATDHAPHTPDHKAKPLMDAPPGMLGLETALALAITNLDVSPVQLAYMMSSRPAQIGGLTDNHGAIAVGRRANIAVIDPATQWIVDANALASKAKNTPYAGMKLTGKVVHTIANGQCKVIEGKAQ